MNLLLDSNTISYILKDRLPVRERLDSAIRQGRTFLLPSVVHYEVTRYLDLKGARRLSQLYRELVDGWQTCDLTFDDWNEAARLWAERHRVGRSIADFDLLLAVLARKQEAILVTSNTRHFEDLGIILEDWALPMNVG